MSGSGEREYAEEDSTDSAVETVHVLFVGVPTSEGAFVNPEKLADAVSADAPSPTVSVVLFSG